MMLLALLLACPAKDDSAGPVDSGPVDTDTDPDDSENCSEVEGDPDVPKTCAELCGECGMGCDPNHDWDGFHHCGLFATYSGGMSWSTECLGCDVAPTATDAEGRTLFSFACACI